MLANKVTIADDDLNLLLCLKSAIMMILNHKSLKCSQEEIGLDSTIKRPNSTIRSI